MREIVYDVFARKNRGDALTHIGYLDAFDDETARVYAWKTYDEEHWFEMCIVPRSAIIPVKREGEAFGRNGGTAAENAGADGSTAKRAGADASAAKRAGTDDSAAKRAGTDSAAKRAGTDDFAARRAEADA